MRKILWLLLVMLLVLPSALAEDAPALHTIWDMPLDITAAEFEPFIKSKIDIDLQKVQYDDTSWFTLSMTEDSVLTMFGMSAKKMRAFFDTDEPSKFQFVVFALDDPLFVDAEATDQWLATYLRLLGELSGRYGEPDYVAIDLSREQPERVSYNPSDLPRLDDGRYDYETTMATMLEWGPYSDLNARWDNVTLTMELWRMGNLAPDNPDAMRVEMNLYVSGSIEERRALLPFDGRPAQPTPAPLPTDMTDAF